MLEILSFAFISLLGAMSPGPDFAIVTRHALTGSRKAGLLASLGVATAVLVHATYCSLGVAVIIAESAFIFRIIQIAGSCYLAYLGIKLLLASKGTVGSLAPAPGKAFLSGFLTNLLNPKATLFILSLFTQFVGPDTPLVLESFYVMILTGTCLLWFCSLTYFITHPFFYSHFARFQTALMKGMGVVLIALAGYVLFSM